MKIILTLMLFFSFVVQAAKPDPDLTRIAHETKNEKLSQPEWKHVPVNRYVAMLEASIKKDTRWVVFEQNNEALWARVRQSVADKLYQEWRAGKLQGTTVAQAFFVNCNRTTMTQADIDNGRLICQIGVATIKPAEFTVFQLTHNTASSPAE